MSTCLTTTSATLTISSPSQLASPTPSTFVKRNGTRLTLDGVDFKAVGPNIYWLGLDENVVPNPSWPLRERVLEVMAVASVMGATTIRSTTLGVSYGTSLSVQPSLGTTNEAAFASIDWAVWAAKSYGLRLIIPVTDQYDYYVSSQYHGGIPTFLRFRNLSASSPSDYGPFYDLSSDVYSDFKNYITTLLTHRSNITGLTLAEEPTILAFETGNELGGWGGNASPPPIAWVTAIADYLKVLAPNTLVLSGTYGVRSSELAIESVDI
ncbi:mannan endo-1,4-beta-mannosidase, partial [Phenoliferia sp. Uapishka_3]